METESLNILLLPEVREAIDKYIECNPTDIALRGGVPHPREVATQVKYLQRARRKLPTYYASRAILPSLAFEQSSSEECAAHKQGEGRLAIDLTCGLGVDTLYLARRFERVVAVEQNPSLAEITRHNLRLMGAENVEVICGRAEEVLTTLPHADLIYIDPDRRNTEGKKVVVLEDCSPNVMALWEELTTRADHITIKLSPMFDTTQAERLFADADDVEVVSLGGECKELLVHWSSAPLRQAEPTLSATALGYGHLSAPRQREPIATSQPFVAEEYKYIIVPDVALRKAGLVGEWCATENLAHHGAYAFSASAPDTRLGRCYQIEESLRYQPKQLRRLTKGKVEIIRHGFPHSSAEILRALGAKEGAGTRWAFAEIEGDLWAFRLK